ncbi:MAG TPA: bifunctional precorrin-2 dehydrogenase/sirohydrochlorin ferrochelatase [Acidimicrobiales bacterium]|nr:bifunctional precorrin-2 dehydrogenase/sirohydrochlorin ferrochelatase [Acidimicrobiales bacterium]
MAGTAPLYPVGLVVEGRPCLVVGGGRVAARKIAGLLACGAAVTVVAPEVHEAVTDLTRAGAIAAIGEDPLRVELRPYRPDDVRGFALVLAATGDPAVDAAVHRDATAAGTWVNVADDAAHCSFVLPAVGRDGPVTLSVATGGASPALATWLRDRVMAELAGAGALAGLLAGARRRLQAAGRSTEDADWRALLDGPLPDLARAGRDAEARAVLDAFVDATLRHTAARPGTDGARRDEDVPPNGQPPA